MTESAISWLENDQKEGGSPPEKVESTTTILEAMTSRARLNQLVIEWWIFLGVIADNVRPILAENGQKEGKIPLGVWKSPTTIVAMTDVGARLKWKISGRGVDLCSRPHRR